MGGMVKTLGVESYVFRSMGHWHGHLMKLREVELVLVR